MTVAPRPLYRWQRALVRLARWGLRVLLAFWLLVLASMAALHWWVMPRLAQYKPDVEAWAGRALGGQVRIGKMEALPNGLIPAVRLEGFVLTAADGQPALEVASAVAAVSPRSLWRKGFEQLVFHAPVLHMQRDASGQWHVAGQPLQAGDNADSQTLQNVVDWLLAQPELLVEDGQLHIADAMRGAQGEGPQSQTAQSQAVVQPAVSWRVRDVALVSRSHFASGNELMLRLQPDLPGVGALEWQAQLRKSLLPTRDFAARWSGQSWLSWEGVDLHALNTLAALLPQKWQRTQRVQGQASVRAWLQWRSGELDEATADLALQGVQARLQGAKRPLGVKQLATRVRAQREQQGWQWQTQGLQFQTLDGLQWAQGDVTLAYQKTPLTEAPVWRANATQMEIGALAQLMEQVLASLPLELQADTGTEGDAQPAGAANQHGPSKPDAAQPAKPPGQPLRTWQALRQLQRQLALWQPAGTVQNLALEWHGAPAQKGQPDAARQAAWQDQPAAYRVRADFANLQAGMRAASGNTAPKVKSVTLSTGSQAPNLAAATVAGKASQPQPADAAAPLRAAPLPAPPIGVSGLSGRVELTHTGGTAMLHWQDGMLALPDVFEEPVPVAQLRTTVQWQVQPDGQVQLELRDAQLANAHAAGVASATWRTYTDAEMAQHAARLGQVTPSRLPGVLQLQGRLHRADAPHTYRYLPTVLPAPVRDYVRQAVLRGQSDQVDFEVKGDLRRFPFDGQAKLRQAEEAGASGEIFRIAAKVKEVDLRYLPHDLLPKDSPPWPDLAKLAGTLVFQGNSMDVQVDSGQLRDAAAIELQKGSSARIANLLKAQLEVNAHAIGPLQQQLDVIKTSPVAVYTGHLLDAMQASGQADLRLKLQIPLAEQAKPAVRPYRVDGQVTLKGNDVRWLPQVPPLAQAQGRIRFSDRDFALEGLTAQALGGEANISARMQPWKPGQPVRTDIRVQGQASAAGLADYAPAGPARALAQQLHGQTGYEATVQTVGARVYVNIRSDLQGLGSNLPQPLQKTATERLPLRLQTKADGDDSNADTDRHTASAQETLQLELGNRAAAYYLLRPAEKSTNQPESYRVHAGLVQIGQPGAQSQTDWQRQLAAASQAGHVTARINLPELDASAWRALLLPAQSASEEGRDSTAATQASTAAQAYAPTQSHWQIARLHWGGRLLHDVNVHLRHGQRGARPWQAQIQAQEVNGQVEYRMPTGGKDSAAAGLLKARLSYLELPDATADGLADTHADTAADTDGTAGTLPQRAERSTSAADQATRSLPALDLDIERLLFAQRDWGHVQLKAENLGQGGVDASAANEWRVSHLSITVPEAQLHARGNWKQLHRLQPQESFLLSGGKRTALQFELKVHDAARLLARLGMAGVLQGGQGALQGHIAWQGSPVKLDYPSMEGKFNLQIGQGQFLKADAGMARLLGVLSLQALPRRLALDFRDIFSDGFAFDFIQGDFAMDSGIISTNNLQMKGVNAAVIMEGQADIVQETQNLRVVVVPEINALTASLVATAINPAVGAGSFIAQLFLSRPLAEAATRRFSVTGSWFDPKVEAVTGDASPAP